MKPNLKGEKEILLTTKKVSIGRKIDKMVRECFVGGDITKYTGGSGDSLTVKDIKRAFNALKKADDERQKWEIEMVSSKSWQRLNKRLNLLIHKLNEIASKKNKPNDWNNLSVAYKCWIAIQPNYYHPVHPDTKDKLEKLLKKYNL